MDRRLISDRYPDLPLRLETGSQVVDVDGLVDTGFDGDVVVPLDFAFDPALPYDWLILMLADGTRRRRRVYAGWVELGSLGRFPVAVSALADEVIVGRGLIDRFLITLDHGRRLVVEP